MAITHGIDISHWQTITNYRAARDAVDFVIIKATTGTSGRDDECRAHHAGFAGKPRGCYHFAMGGDVAREVANFASVWRSLPWEIDPVLDAEWTPNLAGAIGHAHASWVRRFIVEWRRQTGHRRIWVYSGKALLTGELAPARWGADADTPIWAARYYSQRADFSTLGWDNPHLGMYQFTSTGRVPGIAGNVDRDVARVPLTAKGDDLPLTDEDIRKVADAVGIRVWHWEKDNPVVSTKGKPVPEKLQTTLQFAEKRIVGRLAAAFAAGQRAILAALQENRPMSEADMRAVIDNALAGQIQITGDVETTGKDDTA